MLERLWGAEAAAKIRDAQTEVQRVAKAHPAILELLGETALGNSPMLIQRLASMPSCDARGRRGPGVTTGRGQSWSIELTDSWRRCRGRRARIAQRSKGVLIDLSGEPAPQGFDRRQARTTRFA